MHTNESRTAVLIAMARALAHGSTPVARFADPTAFTLLPEDARAQVERLRAGVDPPHERAPFERRSQMMVARTLAVDDAIRETRPEQLVILGAGLDGRAWRMPELGGTHVFEVDQPDSQRAKCERAAALTQTARAVHFVAVDFARDDLGAALAGAGHDSARASTWLWEGVIMYLERAAIDATLREVAARSAAGSTLILAYFAPSPLIAPIAATVAAVGEPLRSIFTAHALRALLAAHGFTVTHDESLAQLGTELAPELGEATAGFDHTRIAQAVRRSPP